MSNATAGNRYVYREANLDVSDHSSMMRNGWEIIRQQGHEVVYRRSKSLAQPPSEPEFKTEYQGTFPKEPSDQGAVDFENKIIDEMVAEMAEQTPAEDDDRYQGRFAEDGPTPCIVEHDGPVVKMGKVSFDEFDGSSADVCKWPNKPYDHQAFMALLERVANLEAGR